MKRVTKNFIKANISLSDSEVMMELYVELANKKRLYTVYESGSGKRTKYVERTHLIDVVKILLPNHDYTTGNDAPRGGRLGDYIQLTTAQYNKMVKRMKWVYDVENALAWDEAHSEARVLKRAEYDKQKENKKNQIQRKAKFNEKLEGILLTDWVALPYIERHPSPKSIYDLKIESGMSWTEFENSIQEVA